MIKFNSNDCNCEDFAVGVEIEKKYIIEIPDMKLLSRKLNYTRSEIEQIYLPSVGNETHRVRSRSSGDKIVYTETVKIRIDGMSSHEFENEITKERFDELKANPRENSRPIKKVRHTFFESGQLFEIDVYPEWKNTCILETELPTRETEVVFPDVLKILRDVTGDHAYSNSSMSKHFPKEIDV